MKTRIGLTQRVCYDKYHERCDMLDHRWNAFILEIGAYPVPIPNTISDIREFINELNLDGIVLTGGNDLAKYGGDAIERDIMETQILQFALKRRFAIIGVCRGLQMIQDFFGGILEPVSDHAGNRHVVISENNQRIVNSYHNYGFTRTSDDLVVTSRSNEGIVESVRHKEMPIYGIMWHPERNTPFDKNDLKFFHDILKGEL